MQVKIIELINTNQDISWLPWGVLYFFFIGLSVAGFFLSLPGLVFARPKLKGLAQISLLIALSCGIAAPIALVSDLHQPARFYHFYLYFTPDSWMSWGAFFLPAYLMCLLLYAWLIYRPALAEHAQRFNGRLAKIYQFLAGTSSKQTQKILALLTAVFATLVLIYTGAEMAIVKTRPLWHSAFMPLIYVTTAFAGASGLGLILNRIYQQKSDTSIKQSRFTYYLLISSSLTAILLLLWLLSGITALLSSGTSLLRLATEYNPASFWLLWVLLAIISPIILSKKSPLIAGLLALFATWIFRWSMFIDGQRIPKTASGFYDYQLPWGSEGLLSLIGSAGLWLLLIIAITHFLPWQQTNTLSNNNAN